MLKDWLTYPKIGCDPHEDRCPSAPELEAQESLPPDRSVGGTLKWTPAFPIVRARQVSSLSCEDLSNIHENLKQGAESFCIPGSECL
jgi:hypothetical protein